jgi:hypothetical protein
MPRQSQFCFFNLIDQFFFFSFHNGAQMRLSEMKLTWTILIVCLSFLTFALPVTILNVYDPDSQHVGPNMQVPTCYLYLPIIQT